MSVGVIKRLFLSLLSASGVLIISLVLVSTAVLAFDRYVDPSGTDAGANDCTDNSSAGAQCLTTSYAVGQAGNGDSSPQTSSAITENLQPAANTTLGANDVAGPAKHKNWLWLIILLLVFAAAVAAYYVYRKNRKSKSLN